MIPVANLLVFLGAGVLLGVARVLGARWVRSSRPLWVVMVLLLSLALLWQFRAIHSLALVALGLGMAVRSSSVLAGNSRRVSHFMYASLPALLALLGSRYAWEVNEDREGEPRALSAMAAGAGAGAGAGAENVMLIVLDTVRADHLSLYGYARETSPNLKRVAEERGIVFDFARSPAPWTLPSHASMFTGRWPHELEVSQRYPFDGRFPTLAERLSENGYATGGFVSNMYYLNNWYGLDRGFLHFEDHPENRDVTTREILRNAELGRRVLAWSGLRSNNRAGDFGVRKQSDDVNRHTLAWIDDLRETQPGRPFFAFLNYLDAHDPYVLPPGHVEPYGRAGDPDVQGELRTWHLKRKDKIDPRTRELMTDAYDTCLAYIDKSLGQLFEDLESRGLAETTWVVITSDHGEHLGEHELYLHGHSLYRPLIDVPLVIVPPKARGIAPMRVTQAVSTRDLPRTLSGLLGLKASFEGRSLAQFWEDAAGMATSEEAEPVLSEADLGIRPKKGKPVKARAPVARGPMQSLAEEGRTYMRMGDGTEELYDLTADPGENVNRAAEPAQMGRIAGYRSLLERLGEAGGEATSDPDVPLENQVDGD